MLACAGLVAAALERPRAGSRGGGARYGGVGASGGPPARVRHARAASAPALWATVNICDTAKDPDSMGIRASMPGNGIGPAHVDAIPGRVLEPVPPGLDGGWRHGCLTVGAKRARRSYARRQVGWTFAFSPPPKGVTFTMRAHVEFEWRARRPRRQLGESRRGRTAGRVIRSLIRSHRDRDPGSVQGGDPAGTSKAGVPDLLDAFRLPGTHR